MAIILCHKCSGLLTQTDDQVGKQLNGCQCISGYVRGWETPLTTEQAIQEQVKQEIQWLSLYTSQSRNPCSWNDIGNYRKTTERLANVIRLAKEYLDAKQT